MRKFWKIISRTRAFDMSSKAGHSVVVKASIFVFVLMTVYELVKQFTFPKISIWESHSITIVFSTIVATIAAYFIARKYQEIERKLLKNSNMLEHRVEERTKQLQEMNDMLHSEIEQHKKARNIIIRLNEELEERVKRRTKELQIAKLDLESALKKEKEISKLKSIFTNMVSHEYRTPLTVILSSSYLIETYLEHDNKDGIMHKIAMIRNSVLTMTKLIDDVMTMGKANEGVIEVKPEYFDLVQLQKMISDEMVVADSQKHKFVFEYDQVHTYIKSDQSLIRQILVNLISNSTKYSPEGSEIITEINSEIDHVEISVSDSGKGISEEDQKHILEPFYRSKNDIGITPGTGLGLAIVKKFVDLLQGQIKVESELGKGTKFTIILPKEFAVKKKLNRVELIFNN